jgi:hypothetical protein
MPMNDLFEKVFKKNQTMGAEQVLGTPESMDFIPTLDGGRRKISPMLNELFIYCSFWREFIHFQDFLSPQERIDTSKSETYQKYFESCSLAWDELPHAKFEKANLSLLGYSFDMSSDSLIVWPDNTNEPEPAIFYSSNNRTFKGNDLVRFLEYYVGDLSTDDSGLNQPAT